MTDVTTVDLPARREAAGLDGQALVGRDQVLLSIEAKLRDSSVEVALTAADHALTMHGGGGIGKTALAIEYCHMLAGKSGYRLVWWVNADSDSSIIASYTSLIERLGGDTDNPHIRNEVDRLLGSSGKWLAVFDNVDNRDSFERWRPQAGGGSILITTRSAAKWDKGRSIPVDTISDRDATDWLIRAAGNPTEEAETAAGGELVVELGGLPLALTMAAAFIHNTPVPLGTYLRLFRQSPVRLLDDPDIDVGNYDKTVYTALAVTTDQLSQTNQDAALLMLEYSSFYAPDDIPLQLFTPEGLGVETETEVLQAMRALQHRSLITPQGADAFSVHRLIQSVTRYYLEHPLPDRADKPGPVRTIERAATAAKVVVIAANSSTAPLNIGEELRNIREGLEHTDQLEAEISPASRPDDLLKYVSDTQPAVVHFSGHGDHDGIALKDDDGIGDRVVPGERLRKFFEGRNVRLVVLNSCYSTTQATAISTSVEVVIGTPTALSDEAARRFSKAFYRTLAQGRTIREALKDGQDAVGLYDLDDEYSSHGDLDTTIINNRPRRQKPQPAAQPPATPTPASTTPVNNPPPQPGEQRSWLVTGYYAAGIVVAVAAVITLALALWPDTTGTGQDPTGPTTSSTTNSTTTAQP